MPDDRMKPKVRVFLDVDGVLNAVCSTPPLDDWQDWQVSNCNGYRIRWSPSVVKTVTEWSLTPDVDVRWLTTWEDHANHFIVPALGLPLLAVAGYRGSHPDALPCTEDEWWKYNVVRDIYERDLVPFVWIDDDLNDSYDCGAFEWANGLGDSLAVSPDTTRGLDSETLEKITAFIDGVVN